MSEAPLSLTVVAGEFPYPPNHGGRVDIWHRLRALSERGVRLQLVCWYSPLWGGPPEPGHVAAVQQVVDELIVLPISVGPLALLRRLALLPRMPSHASSRLPSGRAWRELSERVRRFDPDGLWQDNLWGAATATRLARDLRKPRWVRSHNVEHRYMAEQFRLAVRLSDRIRIGTACLGIRRFETRALREATRVFDISTADLQWWATQGVQGARWLPPSFPGTLTDRLSRPGDGSGQVAQQPDTVLYIGNLHTQNNVDGLKWLLTQVWPRVHARRPQARLLLGGSNPRDDLMALAGSTPGVGVVANPPDVVPLYRQATVLVNPVFAGSGVNIKTVEMLHTDLPIVCTPVGAGGLPPDVREGLCITDRPEAFADLLLDALAGRVPVDEVVRRQARSCFGAAALDALIDTLTQDLRRLGR